MSVRCDYKSASPRQRRRAVRRNGLLVMTLMLVGLFGGLLAYIKGDRSSHSQAALLNRPVPVRPAPPALPAVPVVAVPAVPEPLRPKYDFYTELPKRQVGIQ